jgi:hypothetical protein
MPQKRFRRDLCLIVAALGHYPDHKHLARGGRFVDRRHRHSGQDAATARRGRAFLKFSFIQRERKNLREETPLIV